jgi:hypothetical protein
VAKDEALVDHAFHEPHFTTRGYKLVACACAHSTWILAGLFQVGEKGRIAHAKGELLSRLYRTYEFVWNTLHA